MNMKHITSNIYNCKKIFINSLHKTNVFNPSIGYVNDNVYILSGRHFKNNKYSKINDNPNLYTNNQHPWFSNWKLTKNTLNETIFMFIKINNNTITPLDIQPRLSLPLQDVRIFRFIEDTDYVYFIITYNKKVDHKTIIGWSYMIIHKRNYDIHIIDGDTQSCSNIMKQQWSLWTYEHNDTICLLASYELLPTHRSFVFTLDTVGNNTMNSVIKCPMLNIKHSDTTFLGRLYDFYDEQLQISLSTPAYPINKRTYQAIGYIKVPHEYIQQDIKNNISSPLSKFYEKYINDNKDTLLHSTYISFMFIYRFQITKQTPSKVSDLGVLQSLVIPGPKHIEYYDIHISYISPAFIINADHSYNYFFNVPFGQVVNKTHTVITFSNGDYSSNILCIKNKSIQNILLDTDKQNHETYPFYLGSINDQGTVQFVKA